MSSDLDLELAGVEVCMDSVGVVAVIGVWSPNGHEGAFFWGLEFLLRRMLMGSKHFVIVGDFNINVLDLDNQMTGTLRDILN